MSAPHCSGWCHPMPADVLHLALAYAATADRGDMLGALRLRERWPAGLLECSCESGTVRDGADDCDKCGGIGLYYQAESEAA